MSDETPPTPNTCASCTYWGLRLPHWNTYQHRTCDAPQMLYGKDQLEGAMSQPETAVIEVWEGWGLLVGPQFGCIHWTPASRTIGEDEADTGEATEEHGHGATPEAAAG